MNITWGCKERHLWNCSVRVLKSVKEPNETIVVVLWYGSLLSWNGLWALDCD
jgi:hypothetical protein